MGRIDVDYVIVGSGSAGSTLAARLSEDVNCKVLLIEAGPTDASPLIRVPLAWGLIFKNRLFDWQYETEPEAQLQGRRIECARGKVLGGCTSVNGMVYSRGLPADYDMWATRWGLKSWSWQEVLPFFRKAETWAGAPSPLRGSDGPLHVTPLVNPDRLTGSFLLAALACGWPMTADYNGLQTDGFGDVQATMHQGRRWNVASAYLRPALKRSNLRLLTGALVTRVVIERGRAIGVEMVRNGRTTIVHARREVLLCAGVINSPQLLMLSGIGNPEELQKHGIKVKADLAGVGENLQDHVVCDVRWQRRDQGVLHRALRADRIAAAALRSWLGGAGVASTLPLATVGLVRSQDRLELPDSLLILGTAPLSATPYLRPLAKPYPDAFGLRGVYLTPESRGRVGLRSSDPRAKPVIEQRILSEPRDRQALTALLQKMRQVSRQPALSDHIVEEIAPGPQCTALLDIDEYLSRTASTLHHPVGTCRMGGDHDDGSVLDHNMRVRGIGQLRVVDASSMPQTIRGPISAPIIMLAEKIAHEMTHA